MRVYDASTRISAEFGGIRDLSRHLSLNLCVQHVQQYGGQCSITEQETCLKVTTDGMHHRMGTNSAAVQSMGGHTHGEQLCWGLHVWPATIQAAVGPVRPARGNTDLQ